ncbi:hypothetical protein DBT_2341 [Dissulfuribacter thermophilus]|uniref:Uncharacterized protein n=1 Tax=Dissulfuribacter thermophilus TaxID=1156395 RepID=A0A1B9F2V6_9BACT|nr:hypothetical protein DBT_2341 [Dissulfuribacter thermophilus]
MRFGHPLQKFEQIIPDYALRKMAKMNFLFISTNYLIIAYC